MDSTTGITSDGSPASPDLRHARRSTLILFLTDGIGFGLWAALLPWLQHRLGLSDGGLGQLLLGMVVGAFIAMPLAGHCCARHGSRAVLTVVVPLFCLALCAPVLAPTPMVALLAATLFGGLKGAFDVSVNTQAVAVERAYGRHIMASFQAAWSIGGLVAAGVVGGLLHAGVDPVGFIMPLGLLLLTASFLAPVVLLTDSTPQPLVEGHRTRVLTPAVLRLGCLAFVALFTEGVMMDWGAIYSSSVAGASLTTAPLAYGVFCAAMAAGRLSGDHLVARLGTVRLLRLSGGLSVLGLAVIIALPYWPVTFLGLVACGLGLANLVPVFLRASGDAAPQDAGRRVAVVSMIGYAGFLIGPPLIGGISDLMGLPLAFAAVLLLATLIAGAGPGLIRSGAAGARTAAGITARLATGSRRLIR